MKAAIVVASLLRRLVFKYPYRVRLKPRSKNVDIYFNSGNHKDNTANEWWFKFLNSPNFILNPLLGAIEGAEQKVPTYDEFCFEFNKGKSILAMAFPKAKVVDFSEVHYQAVFEFVKESMHGYEHDLKFLLKVIPLIVSRNAANKLKKIESKIFLIAKECGLSSPTFAFIACLSCLYENGKEKMPSIGRQILKPIQNYSKKKAHNSLMDLNSLNFLIQANAKLGTKIGLCTADKGLLRYWCALRVKSNGKSVDTIFSVSIEFTQEMFGLLNQQEIIELKQRVESYSF